MRVITGTARGRRLETLPGEAVTRPTAERVKEALFSIIQFEIEGRRVLDLFAGSGQLGLEALSRGAANCVFVDNSRMAAEVIRRNARVTGLSEHARILTQDAMSYLQRPGDTFDLAFLDPPYASGLLTKALQLTAPVMSAGGVILCESDADEELPETVESGSDAPFLLARVYRYGRVRLWLYRRSGAEV
ncbi:MAG: 16S rRNA (guanine(966)-N(2))-methyltransferase RsmD [Clostridiales bacterium]|nr:16S rRNA (guanine(966)-N(2))-methyltransferase RsmD [Clostridiales bacterium]